MNYLLMICLLVIICQQHNINRKQKKIMASQAEEAAKLRAFATQLGKVRDEIMAKLAELQAAVEAAGNTSPEVDAATDALAAAIQPLDDIVPDPVPAPEPAPEPVV